MPVTIDLDKLLGAVEGSEAERRTTIARLLCKLFGHTDPVLEDGDWHCQRCGLGEGLVKAMRADLKARRG